LKTDFGINNERQDCKIDTVHGGVLVGGGRVNEGNENGNMVDGLHIHI
jgi:hypothetical protein